MFQAILFDLDGTLLPMEQEAFTRGYFGALCKRFAPAGYEPKRLVDTVWRGTAAMVTNDGSCSNEARFWQIFEAEYGERVRSDRADFDDFYGREFEDAKAMTQPTPDAAQCIRIVKEKGYPVILATNPIFPRVGTQARIAWAGLDAQDFALVTTYENSSFCKPNPAYYAQICEKMQLDPKKCLMVGNDYREDLAAAKPGMETYLVTDCLIAPEDAELSQVRHGSRRELIQYLESLPKA